jgi:hypothetical protein
MSEATSYFAIAVAVIILLVDLWAIVSVFRSDKTVGIKAAWAIGLIVFPVLGLIVWGVAGPRLSTAQKVFEIYQSAFASDECGLAFDFSSNESQP